MIVLTIEDILVIIAIVVIILCLFWTFISAKIEEKKLKRRLGDKENE